MFRVQDLSIAFAVIVAAIFAGIGTGYFNRGPAPGHTVPAVPPAPAPAPMPPAPPVTPMPPVPPVPGIAPTPAPAPVPAPGPTAFAPGDYVEGTIRTWCLDEAGRRTDSPASTFRLTVLGAGQAQFRLGSATGGQSMPGTFNMATGEAEGRLDWPDGKHYALWSARLTREGPALKVAGLACAAPRDASRQRCGAWFWGPASSPEVRLADEHPGCKPASSLP